MRGVVDGWCSGATSLLLGGMLFAGRPADPLPGTLQVRRLELVNDRGDVVGRFATTDHGTELVLGGLAQASLVTDGEQAALNLTGGGGGPGEATLARLIAGEQPALVMRPEAPDLSAR